MGVQAATLSASMLLETYKRLVQPLKHAARRLFVIKHRNYQAPSAGEAVPWTAPRGRRGAWIDLGCWRWDPGMVDDTSVSARPLSDSPTDCFRVPTAQRSHGSSGDCGGLSGCTGPLLQLVYHSHRYCAPSKRRTNFVCRFPHEEWIAPSYAQFGGLRVRSESILFGQGWHHLHF